ncbi:MAG: hypothetical protein KC635_12465 [Myxococcales bacterium]|nr:hypothetical protein [Myxococcales bacterium]MCB9735250.1 hypothetical protein [Deltaproteobacteria bacterium]
MEGIVELIELVAGGVEDAARSDVVVGEPIVLGGVTIVPLSRLSLGLAGGSGEGEGDIPDDGKKASHRGGRGKGSGGGAGFGARVRPVGVAIFSADGVDVLPIADKKGIFDKLFDKVPEVIDMVKKAQEDRAAS